MMQSAEVLLQVSDLKKHFAVQQGMFKNQAVTVKSVDGVSLHVKDGETLGLVGESGCGKTTLGKSILRLLEPTGGSVLFRSKVLSAEGEPPKLVEVTKATRHEMKALRREMQIIFQDPYSSLNPRMTVGAIVGEPLTIHGVARGSELQDRVAKLLGAVGLRAHYMKHYPHEFSGGQRQRIGIARALALGPRLIVADEPVSALDVSVQAQVLNLLEDLQAEYGLTFLFVAHNLSVVKHISDRVAVMYLGKIVELANTEELFENPRHPYTEALLSAIPVPDPGYQADLIELTGDVPSPTRPPSGCSFHPRCRYMQDVCKAETPVYRNVGGGHFAACHFVDALKLRSVQAT
ncbi:MAG: peptide/nickel transport system ATP-binding protein [Bacillota bacterium]|nr:MAG: peptide/nickel transport system ATP-binding protein [Bacillota bacterium]